MPDPELLAKVARQNLERDVRFLSTNWPTRHTLSRHHDAIASYLLGRLKELGYASQLHTYPHSGKVLKNVIAQHPRGVKENKPGGRRVLLCAHFDSRQENMSAPEAPAPGADDNGTGVATVLELARILKDTPLKGQLQLALFSGEEQGEWGSNAYAQALKKQGEAPYLVFNLDQIGYPSKTREVFVDRDEAGPKGNNAASAKLVDRIVELAKTVVKVPTKIDPVEASDYEAFEALGWVVTGLYEGEYRYPHYHKSTDTFDKVDFAYVTDMARLTLAFVADYLLEGNGEYR